jgi:hypothetical protein
MKLRKQLTFLIRLFDYVVFIIRNDATEKYTCYMYKIN